MSEQQSITFDVLIEVPKGSRNKYEYDFELRKIRFDRALFSSMMYPANYGFAPETLSPDQDPLDVLVLSTEPIYPNVVVEVKPVAVFHMSDEKGIDPKLVCVPVSDPIWNKVHDLSDINTHLVHEIEHFFKVYKDLENKEVEVKGWADASAARTLYQNCRKEYAKAKS